MSGNSKIENSNGRIVWYIFTAIVFIVWVLMLIDYLYRINLVMDQCTITDVFYPTSINNFLNESYGFIECDCGRYCMSDLGTCISVYGNRIEYNESTLFKIEYQFMGGNDYQCTLAETRCNEGESIVDRMNAIDDARDNAQEYINMKNTTFDCWYIENEDTLLKIIIMNCHSTSYLII